MNIVLLGPPGSGKGTQARLLAAHYKITKISIGDVIRGFVDDNPVLAQQARASSDTFHQLPEESAFQALHDRFSAEDMQAGFLLVGFPRTALQGDRLDELLESLGLAIDIVLVLEGDGDVLMERLEGRRICQSCGQMYNIFTHPPKVDGLCDRCGGTVRRRSDDNEDTIATRMRIYDVQAGSLLQYYKLQGKLIRVSAEAGQKDVFKTLCCAVDESVSARKSDREKIVAKVAKSVQGSAAGKGRSASTVAVEKTEEQTKQPACRKRVAKKVTSKKKTVTRTTGKKGATKKSVPKKKAAIKKTLTKKSTPKKETDKKKVAVKKTATKKAIAKKSSVEKLPSSKKVVAKKTVVKRTASKQQVVVRKGVTKKPIAKKKPVDKKATTKKKAVIKKVTMKKSAARKPAVKRAAARKKSVTKQATVKKVVTKKKAANRRARKK